MLDGRNLKPSWMNALRVNADFYTFFEIYDTGINYADFTASVIRTCNLLSDFS